jgi:diguanylate cyclase (GGDEF)-like protein
MGPKPPALPFEIEIELLDSLHGSLRSLSAGNLGVAGVTLICAYSSQSRALLATACLVLAAAVIRFLLTFCYHRADRDFDLAQLHKWKNWTIWSASAVSALLGMCGLISVTQVTDAAVNIPLIGAIIGYVGASASRNAGVPTCVKSQLALAIAPLAIGFVLNGGGANIAIAILMITAIPAMIEVSRSAHKTLVRALIFGRDKHALAEAFAEQAANFDAALSNMSHGLAMFDAYDRLVICNRSFAEFFRLDDDSRAKGAPPSAIIRCIARAGLVPRDEIELVERQFIDGTRCRAREEMTLSLRDGRILELSFQAMAHGGTVAMVHDVTERKAQEAKIAHMARFDKLTGLPNRSQFEEQFAEILTRSRRAQEPFAVVCIDLDHFKEVNDTLTHIVGDQLLVAVAARMNANIRASDHLARFGGDEFVLILPSLDSRTAMSMVSSALQRLIEAVAEPYEIDSHAIVIGMSAGVAIAPADGGTRDELLRAADLALYKAKREGRGSFHFFEASLDAAAQERRQIILDMRVGLAQSQFFLEYQPIIEMKTGRIACCEALLRWNHPTLKIAPDKFIAVAEETGMVTELGRWALRQACRDAVAWPKKVAVAVNLSPVQFKRDDLPAMIKETLRETGLDPSRLELEITETLLISSDDATKKTIDAIIALGCSVALDDFGRGYSTFGYLVGFPFKKVKLDKTFIDHIENRAEHRAIIGAIGQLGASLSISIVAEGVETESQLEILAAENVPYAQGWLFSKSVATADIPWKKFEGNNSVRTERTASSDQNCLLANSILA